MVQIPSIVLTQLYAYCLGALPDEACGAFLGELSEEHILVRSFRPISNVSTRPLQQFEFNPEQLTALLYDTKTSDGLWVGIFHSHPSTPAVPSAEDLQSAWQLPLYCIISLVNRHEPAIKAFAMTGQKKPVSIEELTIEITEH